ncbi:MAG: LuxR C-terminal-related transcriptional regulator, partial [Catenulispora sp.]
LADGMSNADIAACLSLSIRTAEHHVAAVLTKLAVDSRRRVPGAARRLGIAVPGVRPALSAPPV